MPHIRTEALIARPLEEVFDYVTTAGNWPRWHPSSLEVRGATDHSGRVGEQITEEYVVAGRRGTVVWTVVERVRPRQWVIKGLIANGRGGGTITYTLSAVGDKTRFVREFEYWMPSLLLQLLDLLVVRRRVWQESEEASRRLKQTLEGR